MSPMRVLKEIPGEVEERQLQAAIESDLSVLEEGLEHIDSEVVIGAGRIDTLALDEEGRPTFIEYKRPGDFGKTALVQLMDYLSWFVKDPNRFGVLEKYIRARKKDIEIIDQEIRLILVVSQIDDRIMNACYVIKNPIKIFSYSLARLDDKSHIIVPKEILDNTDVEQRAPTPPKSEQEIVKEPFRNFYDEIKAYLSDLPGVEVYPVKKAIRASSRRVFVNIRFRRGWLKLGLRAGKHRIKSQRFKYDKQGESNWGNVRIDPGEKLDNELKGWIRMAYEFSSAEELEETGDLE